MNGLAESAVDWKGEYQFVMRKFGMDPFETQGKRKTPRFKFEPPNKIVLIHIESLTGVLCDLSAGGTSFFLNTPLTTDREINLIIDHHFRVRVKVVSTTLDDYATAGFRETYRNCAKFIDATDGYRCTVQSLQLLSRLHQI